jgi:hypothetical protein
MAPKIQFINSTGDFSNAAQTAQKKLVRSHVATQRERQKRLRGVEDQLQKTRFTLPSEQIISPAAWLANDHFEVSLENDSERTEVEVVDPTKTTRPTFTDQSSSALDERVEQRVPTDAQPSNNDDVLRPVHEGGHLLSLPYTPSPHSYLGQGTRDWFVPMPLVMSPRMSKHLFYCTIPSPFLSTFVSDDTPDVNVLMPKLHPSYTTNLVRRTYGCGMLRYADELILASIAAFSATSRALVTGDMEGTQGLTASNAFHDGAFDRLYFKGQTIRLINDRLNNVEGVDVTDASLFAGISSLILIEVCACEQFIRLCTIIIHITREAHRGALDFLCRS